MTSVWCIYMLDQALDSPVCASVVDYAQYVLFPSPLCRFASGRTHRPVCLLALWVAFCISPKALAQGAPQSSRTAQAEALIAQGRPREALSLLTPLPTRGAATCVCARALMELADDPRAALYWERCHDHRPSSEVRRLLKRVRERLRKRDFAPVSLSLEPRIATARIDGPYTNDLILATDDLWLSRGSYTLYVEATGFQERKLSFHVDSKDRILLRVSLEAAETPGTSVVDLGDEAGPGLGGVSHVPNPKAKSFAPVLPSRYRNDRRALAQGPRPMRRSAAWPLTLSGAGLVSVGGAIVLHAQERTTPAVVGYAAGATLIGTALYLWLRSPDTSVDVIPTVDPEVAGVWVRW